MSLARPATLVFCQSFGVSTSSHQKYSLASVATPARAAAGLNRSSISCTDRFQPYCQAQAVVSWPWHKPYGSALVLPLLSVLFCGHSRLLEPGFAVLTWTDKSSNESGFYIERSPNGANIWTRAGTVAANVATYRNTVVAGRYNYRVQAFNAAGQSAYSNTVAIRVR